MAFGTAAALVLGGSSIASSLLGGNDTSAEPLPLWNKIQRDLAKVLGPEISEGIGKGATSYSGQLVADIPEMFTQAYDKLNAMMGAYDDDITNALLTDMSGEPAWDSQYSNIAETWRSEFAVPVMSTWSETVQPLIKEAANAIPGGFRSLGMAKNVAAGANEYFAQYVQPTLFQAYSDETNRQFTSVEAAAARRLPAATKLSTLAGDMAQPYMAAALTQKGMEQEGLSAEYQEFMRMAPENNPYYAKALSFLGIPTTDWAVTNQQDQIPGALMSAAALALMAGQSEE